jgi:hypothetical protein
LYDPEANYFYRGDDKVLAPHAMLYKFWAHQTGRGMIKDHAKFRKIEHLIDPRPGFDDSKSAAVRGFFEAIDKFEKDMNKAMEVTCTESGSSGPSIEIFSDSTNFTTTTSAMEIEGDVVIKGNLEVKGKEEGVTVEDCGSAGRIYITKDADGNEVRRDEKGKIVGSKKKVNFKDKVQKALAEEAEIDLSKINKLVTERDITFEGSKNKMGLEIMRSQWVTALFSSALSRADAFGSSVSNRNVNCGNLRSLGKTEFLRKLLTVLHERCPLPLHMVVARHHNMKEYEDLMESGVLDTLSHASSVRTELMGRRGLLLSDEVHDAHVMERFEPHLAYYFGFYSEGSKGIRFEVKEGNPKGFVKLLDEDEEEEDS